MSGHQQLIGEWEGEEQLFASAWTPAATAMGRVRFAAAPGEGLLLDYTETRDGSPALAGHGVMRGDRWWWFDSLGFAPDAPGSAHWEDDTLVLERRSDRGRNVTRFRLLDGRLEQEISVAVPPEAPLTQMMRGRYARVG